jgi:hypothetical protein
MWVGLEICQFLSDLDMPCHLESLSRSELKMHDHMPQHANWHVSTVCLHVWKVNLCQFLSDLDFFFGIRMSF